jgi:hypothetical protein
MHVAADWPLLSDHLTIKYKGRPNYDVVSYNRSTRNVVAMGDCKYVMEDIDLKRIEGHLEGMAKHIVAKKEDRIRRSSVRLPVLKLSE